MVEFLVGLSQGAAHFLLCMTRDSAFAMRSLQPGKLGAHFVDQRTGGTEVQRAEPSLRVAQRQQVVWPGPVAGTSTPGRTEKSLLGQQSAVLGDESYGGSAPLVIRIANFQNDPLPRGVKKGLLPGSYNTGSRRSVPV